MPPLSRRLAAARKPLPCPVVIALLLPTFAVGGVSAQGTLAEPFPSPAPNAALHYQRGLLLLADVDQQDVRPLARPVWESLPRLEKGKFPAELAQLLYRTRYAIRATTSGTRVADCNFGIDYRDRALATMLPHVNGSVRLGRLLALRGALAESRGRWEEAAIVYFDGIRMGRHLAQQNTLIEALAGIEVLRNHYFSLARWASACPDRALVARSFGLLESMQRSLVDPSRVIAREASILGFEFQRLRRAYPDADWAELLLESCGESSTGDLEKDRKKAIAVCEKRGVPRSVFSSTAEFHGYLDRLQATTNRYAESLAACMTLPAEARLTRAQALAVKYSKLIKILAGETTLSTVDVAAGFLEHEAELTLTRLVLALAASKRDGMYPPKLNELRVRFGGALPTSPYDNQPVRYSLVNEAKEFTLLIPAANSLPQISFASRPPTPAP